MLNLKTRFILEKKKHTMISEISWCNILRTAGSDYYVNIFQALSSIFVSRILLRK